MAIVKSSFKNIQMCFVNYFIFIIFAMFIICTMNINGLNNRIKQQQVIGFMKYHRIESLHVAVCGTKFSSNSEELWVRL